MLDLCRRSLNLCPLSNEIHEHLGFDGAVRCVQYVLPHQLEHPLVYPSFGLGVLDDLPEWVLRQHDDGVCIEVVSELALGHQNIIHELLHLRVAGLGV
jgi:hypothetical protein